MKKFICMILLFTLFSSSVLAQFADQMTKEISVTNDVSTDLHQSQFIFLSLDKKITFITSDSLKMQSYSVWYPFDGETIIDQTLVGVVGFTMGGLVSVGLSGFFCHGEGCIVLLALGLPIFGTLGLSFCVDMAGDGHGGNGSFALTLASSIIGPVSFFGLMKLIYPEYTSHTSFIYLLPVLSLGGAIVGYHLSASTMITTNRTSLVQFEKNQFEFNVPTMKLNRYEYPTTSYGISANVLSINF